MTSLKLLSIAALAATLVAPVAIATPATALQKPACDSPTCPNDPPPPHKPGDGGNPGAGSHSFVSEVKPLIDCRVSGDPKPLPDDLKFRNIGSVDIPAGTRVYWLVAATGDHGYYFVANDLQPGKEIADTDILTVGTPPKDECRSMIM